MNNEFSISQIAQRIKEKLPNVEILLGLESLSQLRGKSIAVVLGERVAQPPANLNSSRQLVTVNFEVWIQETTNAIQVKETITPIETISNKIRDALLGWKPASAWTDIFFQRSGVPEYQNQSGTVLWVDTYSTTIFIGENDD